MSIKMVNSWKNKFCFFSPQRQDKISIYIVRVCASKASIACIFRVAIFPVYQFLFSSACQWLRKLKIYFYSKQGRVPVVCFRRAHLFPSFILYKFENLIMSKLVKLNIN